MRFSEMSDETRDGIVFELALASNPGVLHRRDAYWARRRADVDMVKPLGKPALIEALKQFNAAYIIEFLEGKSVDDLADIIAGSMQGKDRARMISCLGL